MQYWISDGVEQFGPFATEQLLANGLQPHWLVWTEGMENWTRADAVEAIRPLFAAPQHQTPHPPAPHQPPPAGPHTDAPPMAARPLPVDPAHARPLQPAIPVGYHYQPQPTNSTAIMALVCGLGGFIFPMASVMAIIVGHVALDRINRGDESGRSMALAGLILGYLVTGIIVLVFLGFCAIPCTVTL